jgi:CelD/BcsL family acetyltransferase involved in cellulose biosynthesis
VDSGVRLELLPGVAGIERLAGDWQRLYEQAPNPSYVQMWGWHRAYLDSLAPEPDDALYAAVYSGAECLAIIPLVRQPLTVAGIPLKALGFPTHEHMSHADWLVKSSFRERLSPSWLLQELAVREPSVDVLALGPLLADASASAALAANPAVFCVSEPGGQSDALSSLSYETLHTSLSKNFRGNLRKARNKLEAHGADVHILWADTPADLARAFESFLAIEASGWKGQGGTATAIGLDPTLRRFYGQLIERLGPGGACAINVLLLRDHPVAAQFGIRSGDRYYLLKIGYDEAHAPLAPGNLLLEKLLKKYENHPRVKYIDLVSGAEWHMSWKPEVRAVFRHLVFRPSPRGLLAWAALSSKPPLRRLRRRLKERWQGVVSTIRSLPGMSRS